MSTNTIKPRGKPSFPAITLPRNSTPTERSQTDVLQKLTGQSGDGWDKALTRRDFATVQGFNFRRNGLGLSMDLDLGGDYALPTKPTGVEVLPTFNTVFLRWDFPDSQNAWYSLTEIWRVKVLLEEDGTPYILDETIHVKPYFNAAIMVMSIYGSMTTDYVNPNESYVYWIRHVNRNAVAGPLHNTDGALATTFSRPIDVLHEYSQDIYNSEAYQWLQADLGVLDGVNRTLEGAGFGEESGLAKLMASSDSLTDLLAEQVLADSLAKHTQQFEIKAQFSKNFARLSSGIHAAVNADEAYVNRIGVLESKWVNDLEQEISTKINEYDLALSSPTGAIATAMKDLTVNFDGGDAGLEILAETVASNKDLHARWGVKTDVNDKKSGVVFDNDGHMSQFLVDADVFAITNGDEDVSPFVIRDGQTVIKEALIDHAAIYTLIASQITAEKIAASVSIESPQITGGTVTGTTFDNGSGTFSVTSQGHLTAVGAEFEAITIRDINGQVVMSADGISQTYIKELLAGSVIASTVYAENIEGDVTDSKSYEFSAFNITRNVETTLITGTISPANFDRVFNIPSTYLKAKGNHFLKGTRRYIGVIRYYLNGSVFASQDFDGEGTVLELSTMAGVVDIPSSTEASGFFVTVEFTGLLLIGSFDFLAGSIIASVFKSGGSLS